MSSKIKHWLRNSVRNCIKKSASKSYEIIRKLTPKWSKFLGKSSSGAVLEHFGRHLGAKMAQAAFKLPSCCPNPFQAASKNQAKINKKLIKNRVDFCNDFEYLFFSILARFGLQKPFQNEVPRDHFFNLVASIREVWFWTTLLWFCYIFRF